MREPIHIRLEKLLTLYGISLIPPRRALPEDLKSRLYQSTSHLVTRDDANNPSVQISALISCMTTDHAKQNNVKLTREQVVILNEIHRYLIR